MHKRKRKALVENVHKYKNKKIDLSSFANKSINRRILCKFKHRLVLSWCMLQAVDIKVWKHLGSLESTKEA